VSDPTRFLTAAGAAEELTRLACSFERASSRFGAPGAGRTPAERLTHDRAARRLGEHAAALAALVPESVLLAPARAAGQERVPAPPDDLRATLVGLDDAVEALASQAGPVADGELRRLAGQVRADLLALVADVDRMLCGG
jgi:hypothetical protein